MILDRYRFTEGDFKPQYLSFSNAIEALKDDKIDAVFYLSGGPSTALVELSEHVEISFIPIEREVLGEIIDSHPYWTFSEIAAETYPNLKTNIPTIGVPCILVTHKDVSEDAIYSIVKSILEHTDEIAEDHPAGSEYSVENALRGITIPIHQGARKYFLEQKILKSGEHMEPEGAQATQIGSHRTLRVDSSNK